MEFFAGIWDLICMLNGRFIRTRIAIDLPSKLDVHYLPSLTNNYEG